ncbi:MAG: CHAD domain-containing protein [Planktothrix sp.]|uniref:CHAD domain-containing protein n=1 Tax=Planktothrix sp. TaxID=3088171 RepID=UPI0038D40CA6
METKTNPQAQTLGYWAVQGIKKHLEKVVSHESEVLKDHDPEELHQMRVGMRRLRSAIVGFAPVLDLPKSAEDEKIGKIAGRLGKLRDLDVLLETLQNNYYSYLPSSEQEILDQLLMGLVKQRHKVFRVVSLTLESKNYKNLKADLQDWVKDPGFTPLEKLPINEVLPDLLLPQISQLFLHPGWQVGDTHNPLSSIPLETVEKILNQQGKLLHSLRKQVKRVRYQMNLFTNFYSPKYSDYLEDMKAIQSCLGDIQDSMVLGEKIAEEISSKTIAKLPTFFNLLTQNRYQSWQIWEPFQRRYLQPETRYQFRLELLNPSQETENKNLDD